MYQFKILFVPNTLILVKTKTKMANYYRINSDQIDETCLAFIVSGFFWLNSWLLPKDCILSGASER